MCLAGEESNHQWPHLAATLGLKELANFTAEHFGQHAHVGQLDGSGHNQPVGWTVRLPIDAVEN